MFAGERDNLKQLIILVRGTDCPGLMYGHIANLVVTFYSSSHWKITGATES